MPRGFMDSMRIIGRLMEYPDQNWMAHLHELRHAANGLSDPGFREAVLAFIQEMAAMPLIQCQERYTATFDLNPQTSLDVTYHRYGDSEDRGRALQRLQEAYRRAGFERTGGELPDFLPLVLEFLSVAGPSDRKAVVGEVGPGLVLLNQQLTVKESEYRTLTAWLIDLLGIADQKPSKPGETRR